GPTITPAGFFRKGRNQMLLSGISRCIMSCWNTPARIIVGCRPSTARKNSPPWATWFTTGRKTSLSPARKSSSMPSRLLQRSEDSPRTAFLRPSMEATFWQRLVHGVCRLRQTPKFERFAGPDWPRRIMAMAVTDHLHAKQGRSIGRLALEAEGHRLVVYLKRHYRLPWWHGLWTLLRPSAGWSPALQEWEHLRWAREQG